MPQVSTRGASMPASPIRKLVPFADAARAAGTHIFHLNIGQPDIPSPKVAMDAVKDHGVDILAYSHSAGNASYRAKLADYYARHNMDLTSDDMLVTTGGSEALSFAFYAHIRSPFELSNSGDLCR